MAVIFAARSGHPQQLTQLRNIARELVLHILGEPDFGLRLGSRLQPASHGPMGSLTANDLTGPCL
jgi:hypothetical protein